MTNPVSPLSRPLAHGTMRRRSLSISRQADASPPAPNVAEELRQMRRPFPRSISGSMPHAQPPTPPASQLLAPRHPARQSRLPARNTTQLLPLPPMSGAASHLTPQSGWRRAGGGTLAQDNGRRLFPSLPAPIARPHSVGDFFIFVIFCTGRSVHRLVLD